MGAMVVAGRSRGLSGRVWRAACIGQLSGSAWDIPVRRPDPDLFGACAAGCSGRLVLNLHGGGGTGAGQEGLTDFDAVADANNLLVVYPDGYDKSWADGRGASPADRRHVDDVGFLVGLAGKLQNDFGVAPGHVFATGMSNGGFMTNKLACDRADVACDSTGERTAGLPGCRRWCSGFSGSDWPTVCLGRS